MINEENPDLMEIVEQIRLCDEISFDEFKKAETEYFRREAARDKSKDELEAKPKNVEIACPHCKRMNTMPENAGVNVICSYCGQRWYTSGIEVFDKKILKFFNDSNKEHKQDLG